MYTHATLPGLPERLWQAAFFLDLVDDNPKREHTEEAVRMAEKLSRNIDLVVAWRKKKLGW